MQTMSGELSVVVQYRHFRLSNLSEHSTPAELQILYRMKTKSLGINKTLVLLARFQSMNDLELLASS